MHDGELSPSNTTLPVGNPNPHVPTSHGQSVHSRRHMLLPCWGWPWLLGWRGRQVCFPTACLWGWLGLPVDSSAPQTPLGFGGCLCVHQSIPSSTVLCGTRSFRRLPKLSAAVLSFWMLFLQIVAVKMHLCIFPSVPSPLHPPPPTPQERSFAKSYRIRVERKHAEFVQRKLSLPAARLPCLQLCPVPKHCPC